MDRTNLILLTGASGYVGGRLLRALEQQGYRVRCLARRPEFIRPRVAPSTEVYAGNVLYADGLDEAMKGVHTAYYLVHTMESAESSEKTRRGAINFASAAARAGVKKIVYLGSLGNGHGGSSPQSGSRYEVGDLLRSSPVPVIEFRASIIVGSGSCSFEVVRALVERLPVMVTPQWASVPIHPISIGDTLRYLLEALHLETSEHRIFEIGAADLISYRGLLREYAHLRKLRRLIIPLPFHLPWFSSLWLSLITPVHTRVGRMLIEGILRATGVQDPGAREVFAVRPQGMREAIEGALSNEDQEFMETRWSDALSAAGPRREWGGVRFGSRLVDTRVCSVATPPEAAFAPIRRIGGTTGWYYGNWLWRLRGILDLLVGGVGLRRGRRDAEWLRPGDAVDFWRVESLEDDRRLLLAAEMRLPGRAWLEFEVEREGHQSVIRQTAFFDPLGLLGLVYWYALYPVHQKVFAGMLRGIADAARAEWQASGDSGDETSRQALSAVNKFP